MCSTLQSGHSDPDGAGLCATLAARALAALLYLAPVAPCAASAGPSPLARLALELVDAPAPLRADLARVAIIELAEVYEEEAARARRELRRPPRDADLRRWAAAVEALATRMRALAETVDVTTAVEIDILLDKGLYLMAAGEAVVINAPRPRAQRELERRIIEGYCALNLCDPERFERDPPEPAPPPRVAAPRWLFTQGAGPVCETEDGLSLQFDTILDLRRNRQACARLVAELDRLVHALTRAQAGGSVIDWDALAIAAAPDEGPSAVVTLDRYGATLRLRLPILAAGPEPLNTLRPWLAAKLRGTPYHLVILHADRLLGSAPIAGHEPR